jgi:hypothetical protein
MKRKKAANEARRRKRIGTRIANMRVLVFILDDWWALAAELVAVAAPAVPPPGALVMVLEGSCVLKAPAVDREENWAEFETITGTP